MHLTSWHVEAGMAFGSAFAAHLHGRELEVVAEPGDTAATEHAAGAPATRAPATVDQAAAEPPVEIAVAHRWHWLVTSPHGTLLADGYAPSRDAAELAAEDEATAVHPPTPELLDRLLG